MAVVLILCTGCTYTVFDSHSSAPLIYLSLLTFCVIQLLLLLLLLLTSVTIHIVTNCTHFDNTKCCSSYTEDLANSLYISPL